jgi:5-methylcytosine-specific restriction endonuclease McrA
MKNCNRCKESKTFDCFSKDSTKKDGLKSRCKECDRKYYLANNDWYKEYSKKYRIDNADKRKEYQISNSAKIKKQKREYYLANSDKAREYRIANLDKRKEYLLKNADKISKQKREYDMANPEKRKNIDNTRRAKKLANGVYKISNKELKRIYSSPCFYCGSNDLIQADHVIPISKGGRHSVGNLVPACARCNKSKGAKLLIEWRGRKSNLK